MSITDKLRSFTARADGYELWCPHHKSELISIADDIDVTHAEAQRRWMAELDAAREQSFNAGFDDGFASADDWLAQHEDAMREHGWVKLPKDADGEHIRIGDKMEWTDGNGPHAREVTYLQLTSSGWYVGVKGCGLFGALELLRHHKQPTVEDVLEQFAVEVERAGGAFDVADDVWARFAAKLRLAESEGE